MGTMKKKKKKGRPQKTTLKRVARLQRAKVWLGTYTGKHLVKGYRKKYRTDLLTTITELRMLGVEINVAYEEAVKRSVADLAEQRRKLKEAKANELLPAVDQDDTFAYIVGYTSGGAPYGLTWAEMEDLEKE